MRRSLAARVARAQSKQPTRRGFERSMYALFYRMLFRRRLQRKSAEAVAERMRCETGRKQKHTLELIFETHDGRKRVRKCLGSGNFEGFWDLAAKICEKSKK